MFRTQTLSNHRRFVVACIVVAGLATTVALWWNTHRQEEARIFTEFRQRAKTQALTAREHLTLYPEVMRNLETIASFNRPVFQAMLEASFEQLIQRHEAISILEWVPHITAAERQAFEYRVSQQFDQPFTIRQRLPDNSFIVAPPADYYYPIQLAVPVAGNEAVIGYDIRSAPTAARLEQARSSRSLVATPPFTLAQASGPEDLPGIVLIMPVFGFEDRHSTDDFRGFIQCVFQIHSSLAKLHHGNADEALLVYYDDASAADVDKRILYANLAGVEPTINNSSSVSLPANLDSMDPGVVIEDLPIGGRDWRFVALINPDWATAQRTAIPEVLLAVGGLATLLLAFLVNTILMRNSEIERTVERRTADIIRARQLLEKDITRRVVVEKNLRESETLLRGLLDNSTSEIFIKDIRGRYTMFNREYEKSINRSSHEIFSKTDADLFPPEIANRFIEEDKAIIASRQPKQYETQIDLNGRSRTDLVQKFPLIDAEGNVYAICGIVTDLTYRVTAEAKRQLLERKNQSSQRLESLGVLAGGIAHDFNNILTTILGHASMIREKGGSVYAHADQLMKIETAARRASDLCEQMLTYAGQNPHLMELVNFNEIIRDTIVLLSSSLHKSIELPLQLDGHLQAVRADVTQLRQVVMNLVINAADAIGEKPGEIRLHTTAKNFDATALESATGAAKLPPGNYVVLTVSDTGSGIPPSTLTRIFEPFYTTKFHGRGLGLSTVLGIVQSHGGGLLVESSAQTGSTFTVLLPSTDTPAPLRSNPPEEPAKANLSGCALVVDDEESVREITVAVLEMNEMTVHAASSGPEAIEIFRQHHAQIDIVLLDMTMPGLSGSETLVELRKIKPSIHAIILSGYSHNEANDRLGDLNIDAFIQKPFELDTLLNAVATIRASK